jgi:hypothetical protein
MSDITLGPLTSRLYGTIPDTPFVFDFQPTIVLFQQTMPYTSTPTHQPSKESTDSRQTSRSKQEKETRIQATPASAEPQNSVDLSQIGPYDIICGRSSNAYNNIGNRRFRVTIRMFLKRYQLSSSRAERKAFICYLTNLFIHEIGFRFLKQKTKIRSYHDIGVSEARKKIGHALLDQTVKNQKDGPAQKPETSIQKLNPSGQKKIQVIKKAQQIKMPPPSSRKFQIFGANNLKRKLKLPLNKNLREFRANAKELRKEYTTIPIPIIPTPIAPKETTITKAHQLPTKPSSLKGGKGVTKLESEICLLLIGLQNSQNQRQPTQQIPRTIAPMKTRAQ